MDFLLESKSQQVNKEILHYFEFGYAKINEKATLLLIHGHYGSKQFWYKIIEELAQRYCGHVVAVDLRGFGDSTYNQKCNQLKDWSDDLIQFCQVMKIQKCIPIGFCFGGMVAMKLAETAPQIIDKIVLTASVGYQGLDSSEDVLRDWQRIQSYIQGKQKQEFSKMFYAFIKSEKKPRCDDLIDKIMKQRCIDEVHKILKTKSIDIQAIKPILQNSLAIHGVEDQVVTIDDFEKTGKYFKKFIKADNIRHMVPMKYEKIVEVIVDFI